MGRPKNIANVYDAPKSNTQFSEGQKSKGILDDSPVRSDIHSKTLEIDNIKEGTPGHDIIIDNNVDLGSYDLTTTGKISAMYLQAGSYSGGIASSADIFTTGVGDDFWLGSYIQANANFRAYANGDLVCLDTTTTNLAVDHIAEKTGAHDIVIDNDVDLGANDLTTTGSSYLGTIWSLTSDRRDGMVMTDWTSGDLSRYYFQPYNDLSLVQTKFVMEHDGDTEISSFYGDAWSGLSGYDLGNSDNKWRNGYFSGTITSPEYLFDSTYPIKTVWRGGYMLGFQQQTSGYQMGVEYWNKDGDGTDNINIDLWAHGTPTNLANYELFQIGYITNVNEALRYYKISATATGSGTAYPLKLYTGTNPDQIRLNADGGVIMATLKSGATAVAAGAGATELWKTNGHASLPNNVVMCG